MKLNRHITAMSASNRTYPPRKCSVPTIGCSVLCPIVCEKNRALLHRYDQNKNKGEMNNEIEGFRGRRGVWTRKL